MGSRAPPRTGQETASIAPLLATSAARSDCPAPAVSGPAKVGRLVSCSYVRHTRAESHPASAVLMCGAATIDQVHHSAWSALLHYTWHAPCVKMRRPAYRTC